MICTILGQTLNSWCGLVAFYWFLSISTLTYVFPAWLPQESSWSMLMDKLRLVLLSRWLWKTFLPNQITMWAYWLSRCLEFSFCVAAWAALQVCPVPFKISNPNLKSKGCVRGWALCRRKHRLWRAWLVELSAVTGRKGWQLRHMRGLLANVRLRWTLRGCFWSSCWGEQEPFEQIFGLLISCFLGLIISGLPEIGLFP